MMQLNEQSQSNIARAHRFALSVMPEKCVQEILAQLLKSVAHTSIDAVALSVIDSEQERYYYSARGTVSPEARERIRLTLDALTNDDETDVFVPVIQTPCRLSLPDIRPVARTFEGWYRAFKSEGQEVVLIAFHDQQTIVDSDTRQLLMSLSEVLRSSLKMVAQKQKARMAVTNGAQILVNIDITGLQAIREEFGDFEADAVRDGIMDEYRSKLESLCHMGPSATNSISITLQETDPELLETIRLELAEAIRFFPAPGSRRLDANIRIHRLTQQSMTSTIPTYTLAPTMPTLPASVLRDLG
jgi:hypothetical protein